MRLSLFTVVLFICVQISTAQEYKYTDAQKLTVVGKLLPTSNPYHRIETAKYDGFTSGEVGQCRHCAGMAIAFKTDSDYIGIDVKYSKITSRSDRGISGFDLYIRKDGQWLWAGNNVPS